MVQKGEVPMDKNANYSAQALPVVDNNHHSFPEIGKTDNTDRLKASTQKRYESLFLNVVVESVVVESGALVVSCHTSLYIKSNFAEIDVKNP
ncbi:MAG TPA: hypothetical protein DEG17_13105 [Cyanobacteria bacterium UBA11149]|nr:hypothetical protein [Cyanobacteria bacterium UBA11367]HBE60509.1 hypothetical protein [Cyanobacteria bacterium UBA11366]HBK62535.1 hypothetical protein [Cyanobacteria bacterium UBA11166]HBR75067.1 hypothetical protein [Cyanobacteria bacterium UBA11159]HBS71268.1 hypothetical protein [Cyanobacteria bacterium UBA11153]HBW89778.1 hypothetical protein [Cyanobacteria bacterium UBA11149]HCA96068.1 hypothetical protein [Cyanobacteria bacterium UBA9226]